MYLFIFIPKYFKVIDSICKIQSIFKVSLRCGNPAGYSSKSPHPVYGQVQIFSTWELSFLFHSQGNVTPWTWTWQNPIFLTYFNVGHVHLSCIYITHQVGFNVWPVKFVNGIPPKLSCINQYLNSPLRLGSAQLNILDMVVTNSTHPCNFCWSSQTPCEWQSPTPHSMANLPPATCPSPVKHPVHGGHPLSSHRRHIASSHYSIVHPRVLRQTLKSHCQFEFDNIQM